MICPFLRTVLVVASGIGRFILWREPPRYRSGGSSGSWLPRARGPRSGTLLDLGVAPADRRIAADRRSLLGFRPGSDFSFSTGCCRNSKGIARHPPLRPRVGVAPPEGGLQDCAPRRTLATKGAAGLQPCCQTQVVLDPGKLTVRTLS